MAFRDFFQVAVLMGCVLTLGCGGTSGSVEHDAGEDPPPSSGENPPRNPDQPAPNSDRPPESSDRPPQSPSALGGGGRLQTLCTRLCEVIDRCDSDDRSQEVDDLCDDGACLIPADVGVDVPCVAEVIDVLDCALGLSNLCDDDSPLGAGEATQCRSALEGLSRCREP
jgi:hypothetical protein